MSSSRTPVDPGRRAGAAGGRRRERSLSVLNDKENVGGAALPPLQASGSGPPQPPPEHKWQIPSTSRCLACGKLSGCSCRVRIDPDLKRRKLETLLQNTPYMRSKLLRATEELQRDEAKQRRRLVDLWIEGDAALATAAQVGYRLVTTVLEEEERRCDVELLERKSLMELMLVADRQVGFYAIGRREQEERMRLCMVYAAATRDMIAFHQSAMSVLYLSTRELAHRQTIASTESAQRTALTSAHIEGRQLVVNHHHARHTLYLGFVASREAIAADYSASLRTLYEAAQSDLASLELRYTQRIALVKDYSHGCEQLAHEERVCRRQITDEVREEREYIAERQRLLAHCMEDLVKCESVARRALEDVCVLDRQAILVDFHRSRESVVEADNMKRDRRDAEMQIALYHLQSMMEEESIEFHALVEREHVERDLRYRWMMKKEEQRRLVSGQMIQHLASLSDHESEERKALYQRIRREEASAYQWLEHVQRLLRNLTMEALESKSDVDKMEQQARFRIQNMRIEEEAVVRRSIAGKSVRRQRLFEEAVEQRKQEADREASHREALRAQFASEQTALRDRKMRHVRECETLTRHALQSLAALCAEEAAARQVLVDDTAADRITAVHLERSRHAYELIQHEGQSRSKHELCEMRDRKRLLTHIALEQLSLNGRAREQWLAAIAEAVATEEQRRVLIENEADSEMQLLDAARWRDLEEAEGRAQRRMRMALHAVQAKLKEDPRMYNEDESFILSARPSDAAPPQHTGSGGSVDHELVLLRNMVASALGSAIDTSSLSRENALFVSRVVRAIQDRSDGHAATLDSLERQKHDLAKRIAQQRAMLESAKEDKERYASLIKREEQQLSVSRLQMQRSRSADDEQHNRSLEVLRSRTAELKTMKENLSELKERIHKQYQTR